MITRAPYRADRLALGSADLRKSGFFKTKGTNNEQEGDIGLRASRVYHSKQTCQHQVQQARPGKKIPKPNRTFVHMGTLRSRQS